MYIRKIKLFKDAHINVILAPINSLSYYYVAFNASRHAEPFEICRLTVLQNNIFASIFNECYFSGIHRGVVIDLTSVINMFFIFGVISCETSILLP